MKKIIFLIVLGVIPGLGLCGQASEGSQETVDKNRIFSEIAAFSSDVNTLSSDFIQEKHLSMLNNVLIFKGRFYYKRNKQMRWALTEPNESGFSVNGKKVKRWDAKSGSKQTFDVHQVPFIKVFSEQVFAWAKADFKWLQKRYRIEIISVSPTDLKLFPRSSREKEYVDHLRIAFARDAGYVSAVEVHEPDGDFTRIRFLNTRVNEPLQDSLFN